MNIQVNDCVTILGHVGIIDDIAKSENGKTLILWRSFKGIWNHHPSEWLDITNTLEHIKPATQHDYHKDSVYYTMRCCELLHEQNIHLKKQLEHNLSTVDKGE